MASIKSTNTKKKKEMTAGKQDGNQQITRLNKIPRKNNNLATVTNIKQLPTVKKKKIFVVGDSMIKNITGTSISRDHTVKSISRDHTLSYMY